MALLCLIDIIFVPMEISMKSKHLVATTVTLAATLLSLSGLTHAAGDPKVKSAMARSDCFTCHSVDHQVIGPAYKEVAAHYHGAQASAATVNTLAEKIIKGGNGNWNKETGGAPMTAHPKLSKADAEAMARWVLAQ